MKVFDVVGKDLHFLSLSCSFVVCALGSFGALDEDRLVEGWRLERDVEHRSLMNPKNTPVSGKLASF